MKRQLSVLLLSLFCIASLIPSAGAYDYREARIGGDPTVSLTEEMEAAILEEAASDAQNASLTLCVEQAVQVYRFTPEEMLAALGGDLRAALEGHTWTVWKVPIEGGSGYRYAVISGDEFSTCYSLTPPESLTFLWAPDTVSGRLEGLEGDLYLANIPTWGITLYISLSGGEARVMADAGRPDWFGIENWTWYSPEEMREALNSYAAQTGASSGSSGVLTHLALPLSVGAGVILLAVLLVLLPGGKKNNKSCLP